MRVPAIVALSIALGLGASGPPTITPPSQLAAGTLERNVAVPMRDGVILRADVRRPSESGRHPTLVYRTPYDKTSTSDGSLVRKAVARGYAVVVQDVRGRYASDGEYDA